MMSGDSSSIRVGRDGAKPDTETNVNLKKDSTFEEVTGMAGEDNSESGMVDVECRENSNTAEAEESCTLFGHDDATNCTKAETDTKINVKNVSAEAEGSRGTPILGKDKDMDIAEAEKPGIIEQFTLEEVSTIMECYSVL